MNENRNPKLGVFVDGVLAYLHQPAQQPKQHVAVSYNADNDTYWFVLQKEATLVENKTKTELESMRGKLPRLVQLGYVENNSAKPFLLLFMNERGPYSDGTPHTLPCASCDITQSRDAMKSIYNYLVGGLFTPSLSYGAYRPRGAADPSVEYVKTTDAEPAVIAARRELKQNLMRAQRTRLMTRERAIFAATYFLDYSGWEPYNNEDYTKEELDAIEERFEKNSIPKYSEDINAQQRLAIYLVLNDAMNVNHALHAQMLAPVLLGASVHGLRLRTQLKNLLTWHGIYFVGQLTERFAHELIRADGIGKTSIAQIERELERVGLSLKKTPLPFKITSKRNRKNG